MKIVDNVIKEYDLNLLYTNLTSNLVPWTFNHNVAYGDGKMQYGFSTNVYDDGVLENPSLSLLLNPVYKQLKVKELIRCRIGFIFYSGGEEIHDPHIDFEFPHKTSLFYVNNSSGATVIYNEKYGDKFDQYTVKKKIEPVANRIITFNGLQYHSSSSPKEKGYRLVVTFNYR